jgi:hypothetical protein
MRGFPKAFGTMKQSQKLWREIATLSRQGGITRNDDGKGFNAFILIPQRRGYAVI